MQKVTTKAIAKVAAVATGLAMATSMLSLAPMAHAAGLTSTQVQSILSLLSSFGADSATIANVQAALNGQPTSGTGGSTTGSASCTFTKNLMVGASGSEVTCLQNALIGAGYSIPAGATGYFGGQTKAAVIAWQKAAGVSPTSGYFGSISRAHWNLGGGSTGGNTGGNTAGTGNGLKVSLAATSPNGTVLVQGQGIGDLGEFTFANPTSASINVTGLTFKRIGASNDSTLSNVYLFNNGSRITDSAGVSNTHLSINDPNGIFTVPAGSTYTVTVRSDISSDSSGQQVGVALVSVSSSGTLDSSDSFPINSGLQTISGAALAAVSYGTTVSPSDTTVSPQNDYPVWQNTISVSTNPVKLTSLRLTNLGSIDSAYVSNLRLYVDGTLESTVGSMAGDRTVTFDLTSNPVTLSTSSHTIKVLANITGGASRTIIMSVQRSSDAMFVDQQLGQPVTPTSNGGTTFTAVTAGTVTVNSVNGTSGVSVSLDPASPTNNVAVGASSVKWASFDMLASGENVKVSDLYVFADTSVHNGGLDNGKVMVNGVQVGSTKDIGEGSSNKTDFSLGSSLILPAGQTTVVDIYADAKTSTSTNLSNNETVKVSLYGATGLANAQGQSSLNSADVPSTNKDGNQITVTSSSLTSTKFTGYGDQTMVAGTTGAKIGSFTLSTGSTEGVTVNTIVATTTTANAASITNLTLKDHATGATLGSVIATPSTSNSFAVNLDVPASSSKTIDVYADILSGANAGSLQLFVGSGTTGTGDATGQSVTGTYAALQNITLGSGTLSVTRGAGDPVSNNVLAGASNVNVGEFNFAASNSSYTVQKIDVLIPNNEATSVTNVTLTYKDKNGATQTVTQPLTVSASNADATASFTGLTMYVPNNDSANLDVSVGTPTIASGATSGTGINVTLDTGTTGTFQAIDSSGSSTTTINSGTDVAAGGTFYVRKSIPTIAKLTPPSTIPATGTALYRFSVTADPAGAVEWTKFTFNIATTSATVTNVYLTDESTGTNLLDNTTSSASTTATAITVDLTKNATQPKYQQIAAGATKTYDLYGTVAGFTTGSTITISLATDSSHIANEAATTGSGSTEWSDRSASSHSISTTDWTNGYLLKDFTNSAISYSK